MDPFVNHNYIAIALKKIPTLGSERCSEDLKFIFKWINNDIEFIDLTEELNFRVPSRKSRLKHLFIH